MKTEADRICGVPEPIRVSDRVVAAIKWVDETVIDVARQLTLP